MLAESAHGDLLRSTNLDLWTLLRQAIRERSRSVDPYNVKAHVERKIVTGKVPLESYFGNLLADAGAGVTAENSMDILTVKDTSDWERIAFLITKRLTAIAA